MEQLYHTLKPGDQYYRQWKRFRNGLIWRSYGGMVLMPLVIAIILLLSFVGIPLPWLWGIAVGGAAILHIIAIQHYHLRCPYCGRDFYRDTIFSKSYMRQERCQHCECQLYAPNDNF